MTTEHVTTHSPCEEGHFGLGSVVVWELLCVDAGLCFFCMSGAWNWEVDTGNYIVLRN